jgi:hypothetical protein
VEWNIVVGIIMLIVVIIKISFKNMFKLAYIAARYDKQKGKFLVEVTSLEEKAHKTYSIF